MALTVREIDTIMGPASSDRKGNRIAWDPAAALAPANGLAHCAWHPYVARPLRDAPPFARRVQMRSIYARESGGPPRRANLGASGRAERNGMSEEHFTHANATGVTNSPDITYIGLGFASRDMSSARRRIVTPKLGGCMTSDDPKVKENVEGTVFASYLDRRLLGVASSSRTVLVTPHLARPRSLICSKVAPKGQVSSSSANTRRVGKVRKQDGLPSSPRGVRVTPLLAGNDKERTLEQEGNTKYPGPNGSGFHSANAQIIGNLPDRDPETIRRASLSDHEVQTVTKAEKGGYEDASLL